MDLKEKLECEKELQKARKEIQFLRHMCNLFIQLIKIYRDDFEELYKEYMKNICNCDYSCYD